MPTDETPKLSERLESLWQTLPHVQIMPDDIADIRSAAHIVAAVEGGGEEFPDVADAVIENLGRIASGLALAYPWEQVCEWAEEITMAHTADAARIERLRALIAGLLKQAHNAEQRSNDSSNSNDDELSLAAFASGLSFAAEQLINALDLGEGSPVPDIKTTTEPITCACGWMIFCDGKWWLVRVGGSPQEDRTVPDGSFCQLCGDRLLQEGKTWCPNCHGSKKISCRSCGGSGQTPEYQDYIGSTGHPRMLECDKCKGTGKVICSWCGDNAMMARYPERLIPPQPPRRIHEHVLYHNKIGSCDA